MATLAQRTGAIVGSVVVVSSFLCYSWYRRLKKAKEECLPFPDSGIPCVPNPHWLTGHLSFLGQDVIMGQRKLVVDYASSNGLCSFWTFNVPVLSVLDAKLANRILRVSSLRQSHPYVNRHFKALMGEQSLILSNGKAWRNQRLVVQRVFQSHENRAVLQESILQASMAVEKALHSTLKHKGNANTVHMDMDLVTLCRVAMLHVFGVSSLGFDFDFIPGSILEQPAHLRVLEQVGFKQEEFVRRCFHERFSPAAQYYWIPTPSNLRHARETRRLKETLKAIVQKRRQELEKGRPAKDDIIGSVLREGGMADKSDEFLSDWLITILFGGFETSAVGMAHTLYLLAKHPTHQMECSKEARRVLGDQLGKGEAIDASQDLPFISACLLEGLRFYPPTTVTARNLDRPLEIAVDGKQTTLLPTGTRVIFSMYWMNHSEINFKRPNEYLPQRWVQKREDGTWEDRPTTQASETDVTDDHNTVPPGDRSNVISFSSGSRNCVGQPLAMRMIPTILATFLRSFEFELADPNYELQLERYGAGNAPAGGIPIVVRLRDSDDG
jgi:cytochrome P450